MNNTNPVNGLKDKNSPILKERDALIYEQLDLENILSLIRIKNSDSIAILEKVKAISSLLTNKRRYNYLKNKSLQRSNGGIKVRVGSAVVQEFRVISIITESFYSISNTILVKYLPSDGYLKDTPGTINSFSLKKAKLQSDCWENNAEINILGNFDKEYYVKFNFFTYN